MDLELLQTAFETSTTFTPSIMVVQAVTLVVLSGLLSIVYFF